MDLTAFQIDKKSPIIEALKKIDFNKKGFLIVVEDNRTVGVLTDGDIRRAFIKGYCASDNIREVFTDKFISININDDPYEVIDIFKNETIDFLPIVDNDKRLCNIITKKEMHSMLMQDIEFNLQYDFLAVDDSIVEHEIYHKPWGFYKTSILNQYFQAKTIKINPESSLSLQEHIKREEHWVVVHGQGKAQIGESIITVAGGSYLFIPKGCKHRLTNISKEDSLIIAEIQLGTYFGEDDIIRYEDIYGRK